MNTSRSFCDVEATGCLDSTAATLGGLALCGAGLAALLPISISAAGADGDAPVPVAVARISTLAYLGSFTAPALIGYLATRTSLPAALLAPAIAVSATAVASPVVRPLHRRAGRS